MSCCIRTVARMTALRLKKLNQFNPVHLGREPYSRLFTREGSQVQSLSRPPFEVVQRDHFKWCPSGPRASDLRAARARHGIKAASSIVHCAKARLSMVPSPTPCRRWTQRRKALRRSQNGQNAFCEPLTGYQGMEPMVFRWKRPSRRCNPSG